MNFDQIEEMLALLKRIAVALEQINKYGITVDQPGV